MSDDQDTSVLVPAGLWNRLAKALRELREADADGFEERSIIARAKLAMISEEVDQAGLGR